MISKKYIEFKNEKINISDIDVRLIKNKDTANQEIVNDFSVYLDIELDEELVLERISRELVSAIQKQRKDLGFDITDRISLVISTIDESVLSSVGIFKDYILNETLTTEFEINEAKGVNKILDYAVDITIKQT